MEINDINFLSRCVICREKILRLKQHHKKVPRSTTENGKHKDLLTTADLINVGNDLDTSKISANDANDEDNRQRGGSQSLVGSHSQRLPNSASNYSINNSRLSASSSNQSFASGSFILLDVTASVLDFIFQVIFVLEVIFNLFLFQVFPPFHQEAR